MQFHEYNAGEVANRLRIDYDREAGRPRSVTYEISGASSRTKRASERSFGPDVSTSGAQTDPGSHRATGFERGHLAQRAAARGDVDTERSFDLMTNVVPMTRALNRGAGSPWAASERGALRYASQYGRVQVRIEPIYDANPPRMADGAPIPKVIRRTITTTDGTVLEDATHLNR